MPGRFRRIAAAFSVLVLLAGAAAPAMAEIETAREPSSKMVDLLVLRPMGVISLVLGTVLFIAPVAPFTLLIRPQEFGVPFKAMVASPARYVWADPLGSH
jgi:hypothetical protein